jgi:hypothetical protein
VPEGSGLRVETVVPAMAQSRRDNDRGSSWPVQLESSSGRRMRRSTKRFSRGLVDGLCDGVSDGCGHGLGLATISVVSVGGWQRPEGLKVEEQSQRRTSCCRLKRRC